MAVRFEGIQPALGRDAVDVRFRDSEDRLLVVRLTGPLIASLREYPELSLSRVKDHHEERTRRLLTVALRFLRSEWGQLTGASEESVAVLTIASDRWREVGQLQPDDTAAEREEVSRLLEGEPLAWYGSEREIRDGILRALRPHFHRGGLSASDLCQTLQTVPSVLKPAIHYLMQKKLLTGSGIGEPDAFWYNLTVEGVDCVDGEARQPQRPQVHIGEVHGSVQVGDRTIAINANIYHECYRALDDATSTVRHVLSGADRSQAVAALEELREQVEVAQKGQPSDQSVVQRAWGVVKRVSTATDALMRHPAFLKVLGAYLGHGHGVPPTHGV